MRLEPNINRLLDSQPWELLEEPLARAGADPAQTIPKLRQYAALLLRWNRSVSNLISGNDEARLVTRHFLESIRPAHLLMESGSTNWIDFGSGAGLPAVPLMLAGIGPSWTLVEARRPKILFIQNLIKEMDLSGLNVVHGRLETAVGVTVPRLAFDGFTSRATVALGPTLMLAAELVEMNGYTFLWKGSRREEEMEADRRWEGVWELDGLLGIGDGSTVVVRFKKKI